MRHSLLSKNLRGKLFANRNARLLSHISLFVLIFCIIKQIVHSDNEHHDE